MREVPLKVDGWLYLDVLAVLDLPLELMLKGGRVIGSCR